MLLCPAVSHAHMACDNIGPPEPDIQNPFVLLSIVGRKRVPYFTRVRHHDLLGLTFLHCFHSH